MLSRATLAAVRNKPPVETARLKIAGMTGIGCANSVTRVLRGLPGVADASVSLTKARALVTYDPAKTGLDAMKRAIERAGYKPT